MCGSLVPDFATPRLAKIIKSKVRKFRPISYGSVRSVLSVFNGYPWKMSQNIFEYLAVFSIDMIPYTRVLQGFERRKGYFCSFLKRGMLHVHPDILPPETWWSKEENNILKKKIDENTLYLSASIVELTFTALMHQIFL